ncbi:MAG: SelT/SelW/SelH family protein [Candidatus Marinimicrobia bacterium]|nr:SelT/SelW/SelH family protein [Candidatus Neomarinimicrobiota bacterium]MBT3633869.1 SelT/SelW/SelH family protein [Candidatus Neomarinimicrobiota bacterium]MBT3682881.1 SelT/SelW/SelH family protein [Candidatus Neomarinimicrobiota bacterium]MBT3759932.1 SelT/SelW/SelH family protein [Candidatus Neomarinimicrobiota bacterium]MBT3896026.1 SelT/SelW/SelH family protein [Candidatus Neomarinimicrobiota bacterium]
MSKLIKNAKSTAKITGNPKPPRSGAFEITIDGKQIFSKFESGRFPSDSDVNSWF